MFVTFWHAYYAYTTSSMINYQSPDNLCYIVIVYRIISCYTTVVIFAQYKEFIQCQLMQIPIKIFV
jgi:hypothetical protein